MLIQLLIKGKKTKDTFIATFIIPQLIFLNLSVFTPLVRRHKTQQQQKGWEFQTSHII